MCECLAYMCMYVCVYVCMTDCVILIFISIVYLRTNVAILDTTFILIIVNQI